MNTETSPGKSSGYHFKQSAFCGNKQSLKKYPSIFSSEHNRLESEHTMITFLCPLFPSLSGPWSLVGYSLCKIGLVWRAVRRGGMLGTFSCQRFSLQLSLSLFVLPMVLSVTTSSDCYLGPIFPILTA